MIKKHVSKACCGAASLIYELDKPIRKYQIKVFQDAGYLVPDSYLNLGVFYVSRGGIVATASFGAPKIQVRTNASTNNSALEEFEKLLEQAINLES